MKLYINRAPVHGPYGGGNLWVKAAYKYAEKAGHEVFSPDDFKARPDAILLAGIESDGIAISAQQAIMYKMYMGSVKLIARINENDARKGTNYVDDNMITLSEHIDGAVFVSNWLRDYYLDRGWKCSNNTVIYNGVDRDIFKPNQKINNGKLNIVAHHWSDNYLKGFDIYEKLDEFVSQAHPRGAGQREFTFTYIGRDRKTFKNTNVVKPLFGKALGEELGKYDFYVSASRFDPGPNHCLEALSCGIPTYVHKDGGGCVEFVGTDHVYTDWDDLQSILTMGDPFANDRGTQLLTWEESIKQYLKFIEETK
jgi:glycosyltransferase involved in cell wall biosynthesis